jgi:hypothetical protein
MQFVNCPNCSQSIEIVELNCRIFRCGVFRTTFTQIDPHLCKERCEELVRNEKIYGCGKPFQAFVSDNSGNVICKSCDYI